MRVGLLVGVRDRAHHRQTVGGSGHGAGIDVGDGGGLGFGAVGVGDAGRLGLSSVDVGDDDLGLGLALGLSAVDVGDDDERRLGAAGDGVLDADRALDAARSFDSTCYRVLCEDGAEPRGSAHDGVAAVTGPGDSVALGVLFGVLLAVARAVGRSRALAPSRADALDGHVHLLLGEVVVRAGALTVVEAGHTAPAVRGDVVDVTDGGVAVGRSTSSVAQQQEALQRRWELPRPRLDGDDLPGRGVHEQLPQHRSDLRPVGPEAVVGRILGRCEQLAQLLPQRLGGDGAVALDVRGVSVLG